MIKLFICSIIVCLLSPVTLTAQSVAINTTGATANASSIIDISSTIKGMLVPRMNATQRTAIAAPANGLLVYDNDSLAFAYYDGTIWNFIKGNSNIAKAWGLKGNAGTTTANFLGTTDAEPLRFRINNKPFGFLKSNNLALGEEALLLNSTGNENIAFGTFSLSKNTTGSSNTAVGQNTLISNTIGYNNIAVGKDALYKNTEGYNLIAIGGGALYNQTFNDQDNYSNIAIGFNALYSNTTGSFNTAIGDIALVNNITGKSNTAIGFESLAANTTGGSNTANGADALKNNTTGIRNTAIGRDALYGNTTGGHNTALGVDALLNNGIGAYNSASGYSSLGYNTSGSYNTANGAFTMYNNATGYDNTAIGSTTLQSNQTGIRNTAIGARSLGGLNAYTVIANQDWTTAVGAEALGNLQTSIYNTAVGGQALLNTSTGGYNTAVGVDALFTNTTGNYNTALGMLAGFTGTTNIDNTVTIGYNALTNTPGLALLGNTTTTFCGGYKNWSNFSDGRFKTNITENVVGLDFIKALRPVTYKVDLHSLNKFIYKDKTEEYEKAMAKGIEEKMKVVETGFIAQEVEAAAKKVGYNFDGVVVPKDKSQSHYAISYASFVVPLVKGMQEQQTIIETQNSKIDI